MPSLLDPISECAKILLVGDSGEGKTGAKAALVAMGYKLHMVDTDYGFKVLRGLLTDEEHYPYASYMKKKSIDPNKLISYVPIEVEMDFQQVSMARKSGSVSYNVLGPTNSKAWNKAIQLLKEWNDGGTKLGSIFDWDNDTILDFDSISSLAECAKYWMQDMNNHIGAFEDDHGRDSGGAQELIRRLMTMVTSPKVRANVIFTTHISWVDTGRGFAQSPAQLTHDQKPILDMKGFPAAIGQALAPQMGKKWNDLFIVRRARGGEQRIHSTAIDNINAKHSAYVEPSYPLATGLAEIFSALRYQDPPYDFLEHVKTFNAKRGNGTAPPAPSPTPGRPSGFGR